MTAIKERLIGAVTVMDDEKAERLWNLVIRDFQPRSWNDIEEIEPDEMDLIMLKNIDNDPECHQFTPENEIDWDK